LDAFYQLRALLQAFNPRRARSGAHFRPAGEDDISPDATKTPCFAGEIALQWVAGEFVSSNRPPTTFLP
jgi:hypothetical protein